jgi:hypothetical protein
LHAAVLLAAARIAPREPPPRPIDPPPPVEVEIEPAPTAPAPPTDRAPKETGLGATAVAHGDLSDIGAHPVRVVKTTFTVRALR